MINEIEVGKKYRLIDIEGFVTCKGNGNYNRRLLNDKDVFDENLCLVITTEREGCGGTDEFEYIISPNEYHLFELVDEPEQKGHVHAELMAQYAEDAKTTDKPWELWQVKLGSSDWADCTVSLLWVTNCEYRRKPKTHIVNDIEIPDLRITPDLDQHYWYPDPSEAELVLRILRRKWSSSDNHRITNNLCYEHSDEGREAAIMHSKAWLGIA